MYKFCLVIILMCTSILRCSKSESELFTMEANTQLVNNIDVFKGVIGVMNINYLGKQCYENVCNNSTEITLAVLNQEFEKKVGINFTLDDWKTQQVSYASYKSSLNNNFELWVLQVSTPLHVSEIEFAAFATMGGNTYWDVNNNYLYTNAVTMSSPVKNQNYFVNLTSQGNLHFVALARGFDFSSNNLGNIMVIHAKIDNGAEILITGNKQKGNLWKFDVVIPLFEAKLPDNLTYYIEYVIEDGYNRFQYYDNNNGNDYKISISPNMSIKTEELTYESVKNTHIGYCKIDTDLPIMDTKIRFVEQNWQEGSAMVFSMADLASHSSLLECQAIVGNSSHIYNKIDSISLNNQ